MDREVRRKIEDYRRDEAGPIENNLIDELVAGEVDRHEFLRRGAMFGLSAGAVGAALGLVGEAPAAVLGSTVAKQGGTLRIAITVPVGTPEPSKLADIGGIGVVSPVVEYLTFSDSKNNLKPWLATSWKPNKNASVWTFQIRKGVKFHNGGELTADDVVASMKVAASKESQAASVFAGILAPSGVRKTGKYTVQFRLQQPAGGFPFLVSQTTYQAPILPKNYKVGTWIKSRMPGTGPYMFKRYVPGRSAEYVAFPGYWGGAPPLDGVVLTMFESTAPQVLALRGGQVDLVQQVTAQDTASFADKSKFWVQGVGTANHRQFGLRTDDPSLRDPRTRRAVALTLNRPELVEKLWSGQASIGNEAPFWKGYPGSDRSTAQRVQNIRQARQLLAASGQSNLKFTITTWRNLEMPDYAQIIQASAKRAGIDVKLDILTGNEYYGAPQGADYATTTPWLNRQATITEYGHRAIPNVYLTAALATGGEWNASKYSNKQLDSLTKSYIAATDVAGQRKASKAMTAILLRDTPVIFAYFYNYISAGSVNVKGFTPDGISFLPLRGVSMA